MAQSRSPEKPADLTTKHLGADCIFGSHGPCSLLGSLWACWCESMTSSGDVAGGRCLFAEEGV